jgi:hypothetical protein
MSQSTANGGLNLGPTLTSAIFLSAILFTVIFLTITKRDMIAKSDDGDKKVTSSPRTVFAQVVVVLSMLVFIFWGGYHWRRAGLQISTTAEATQALGQTPASDLRPLGDLSPFKTITVATLELVDSGNLSAAKTKVRDLETAWDNTAGALKRMNKEKWAEVDDSIDTVLRQLRAFHQDSVACQESLHSLLTVIDTLNPTPSQIKDGHAHG